MKPELDNLEMSVGSQLRQALPPIPLSPQAIERMRPQPRTANNLRSLFGRRAIKRPWPKWVLAGCMAAVVATTAFLGLTPAGHALASVVAAKVTSLWTGTVGNLPAELVWVEDWSQVKQVDQPERVETVQEAAKKAGFQPVQATLEEARLIKVEVTALSASLDGSRRGRGVLLRYEVKGQEYVLITSVTYRKRYWTWRPISPAKLIGWTGHPTANVHTVKIGETEGLAFEDIPEFINGGKWASVTWLPAGNQRVASVFGPDPVVVEALAKSAR